ncbi:MAG: DNA repair protein RecO [Candidatus Latescibacteria bacterium]|jgi:DNA repair protein RecO (recombination protein O)|nr:DNA repair protein RecO [Candidatus Latescibacterota bacterium]MBT4140494.1 DNA repair protein RecO [Candidatus Latescibacterota bacterium]MBT5830493.1 DNA repair protein RecO [Candidatus Latescibacterota bacterium]
MIVQTEGLVLRNFRMSESSKVVIVYTRNFGKVRLVAKGARRPKSKFGASLEPLTWGRYMFYKRENRDIQTLSEGDIVYAFESVKQHYGRLAAGCVVCELLDHMTEDEDRNPLLFRIALDTLKWIRQLESPALDLPIWYFQLKAAGELGYRPHLSGCVDCGSRLEGDRLGFSPLLGGVLCGTHAGQGLPVSQNTIAFLEQVQVGHPDKIDVSQLSTVNPVEITHILRSFLDSHMASQYRPKAFDFFENVMAAERTVLYQATGGV